MTKRGRKRVHTDNAEKQKKYRDRKRKVKQSQESGEQLSLFPAETNKLQKGEFE